MMVRFDKNLLFLVLGVFLCFLCLNWIFPPQTDDIMFYVETILYPDRGFLYSYFETNGKFGEQVLKFFAARYIHSFWLEILISVVSTIFVFVLYFLIFLRNPKNKLDYLSFFLICTMILNVNFSGSFLWIAGNLNYIWGLGLIMIYLIPYRLFWNKYLSSFSKKHLQIAQIHSVYLGILLLILGVFAGWSSENVGAIICLLLGTSIGFSLYKKISLPSWYYLGALGFWCGWLILFFSPGSANRGALIDAIHSIPFSERGFVTIGEFFSASLYDQFVRINTTLNSACRKSFAVFFLVLMWFVIWKNRSKIKNFFILSCMLSIGFTGLYFLLKTKFALIFYLVTLAMIVVLVKISKKYLLFMGLFVIWMFIGLTLIQFHGQVGLRARMGEGLILATMIVLMFREFYLASEHKIWISRIVIALLCGSVLANLVNWGHYAYSWNQVVRYIDDQKRQGNFDIVISKNKFYSFYDKDFGEMGSDIYDEGNQLYAQYFGVKSFCVK